LHKTAEFFMAVLVGP